MAENKQHKQFHWCFCNVNYAMRRTSCYIVTLLIAVSLFFFKVLHSTRSFHSVLIDGLRDIMQSKLIISQRILSVICWVGRYCRRSAESSGNGVGVDMGNLCLSLGMLATFYRVFTVELIVGNLIILALSFRGYQYRRTRTAGPNAMAYGISQ